MVTDRHTDRQTHKPSPVKKYSLAFAGRINTTVLNGYVFMLCIYNFCVCCLRAVIINNKKGIAAWQRTAVFVIRWPLAIRYGTALVCDSDHLPSVQPCTNQQRNWRTYRHRHCFIKITNCWSTALAHDCTKRYLVINTSPCPRYGCEVLWSA